MTLLIEAFALLTSTSTSSSSFLVSAMAFRDNYQLRLNTSGHLTLRIEHTDKEELC